MTCNFGDDGGFVVAITTKRDGAQRIGGVVLEDGKYSPIEHATIDTDWRTDDSYHERIRATARTARASTRSKARCSRSSRCGTGARRPTAISSSRISEGMTEWRCDGKVGYGLSEYLDQIVDGKPVGVAA